MKKLIATRVAADLEQISEVKVQTIKGRLGELSVDINGQRVFAGGRISYPTPTAVIRKVRAALAGILETAK